MSSSKKPNLRIPGPVPLPDDVLEVMASQMINHRGPEYADMLDRMTANLQTVLMTRGDAYFVTSSGTGGMETAIVNTLSPGDNVLSLSIGWFGQRFADIAEAYGANVARLESDLGQPAYPDRVREQLRSMSDVKAVLITHNESSTGVCNPLQQLCEVIHAESDALILVDAVSSAGGVPIATDAWGIDAVATASQKSWVSPPGISMVTFSEKAWKAYETAKMPKYYFDIAQYRDYLKIGQPPFTPALTAMFCLEKSLEAMVAEGVENVFARHHEVAQHARDGARSLGLQILPEEKYASDTVTAIKLPENLDGKTFLSRVNREFNVILGGGQQKLTGKIFRVGHMGWVETAHIDEALEAAGKVLADMRA